MIPSKGQRTGLKIKSNVELDAAGFEDLDTFWNDNDDKSTAQSSSMDDSVNFDYDTSDSISDDDDDTMSRRQVDTPVSRRTTASSALPLEDSPSPVSQPAREKTYGRAPDDSIEKQREIEKLSKKYSAAPLVPSSTSLSAAAGSSSSSSSSSSTLLATFNDNDEVDDRLSTSFYDPIPEDSPEMVVSKPSKPAPSAAAASTGGASAASTNAAAAAITAATNDDHMYSGADEDDNGYGYDDGVGYGGDDLVETVNANDDDDDDIRVRKAATSQQEKRRVSFGNDVSNNEKPSTKEGTSDLTPIPKKGKHKKPLVTPGSVHTIAISTPGSNDFPRGRVVSDDSYRLDRDGDSDGEDDEEDGETDKSAMADSFVDTLRRQAEEEEEEEGEAEAVVENGLEVRRSRRKTKGVKLAYWKNERPIYKQGHYVGFFEAEKTPKKPTRGSRAAAAGSSLGGKGGKVRVPNSNKSKREMRGWTDDETDVTDGESALRPVKLPKGVKYLERDDRDGLRYWDDFRTEEVRGHLLCSKQSLYPPTVLDVAAERRKENAKFGEAAQYFNYPSPGGNISGWIAGYIDLPPGAVKDVELTGSFQEIFFVADCQPLGVELALGDPAIDPASGDPALGAEWDETRAQRVLLTKGDCFTVPPGNLYKLENHSRDKKCTLYWTIVMGADATSSAATSTQQTAIQA